MSGLVSADKKEFLLENVMTRLIMLFVIQMQKINLMMWMFGNSTFGLKNVF